MMNPKSTALLLALSSLACLQACDSRSAGVQTKQAFVLPADDPAQKQTLIPAQSQMRFTFTQMGVGVEGGFKAFAARVSFDPAKPEAAQATITVDLSSIDVGGPDGNVTAKQKDWFDVVDFPAATFTAKDVKALGGNAFEARGPLVIKGVSRDIVAHFTAKPVGGNLELDGNFPVERLPFRLGEGAWADTKTVADDVQVKFRLTLRGRA